MKITLRQLQVFDAVAALGSVTAAADRLGMSQSAVSGALGDFQVILRRQLFVHSKGRALRITEDGRALQAPVRSLLGDARAIEESPVAPLSGRLVVGATTTIAETVLPQLCVQFMRAHPGVRVDVAAAPSIDLSERLGRLDLDTALVEVFPDVAGVTLTHWRTDEMWLVVPPAHPLAGRGRLTRADLAGAVWCLRGPHSAVAGRLRYELHQAAGQLDIGFQSTSPWAVRLAVLAGGGIGCLSRTMLQYDVDHGQLVRLEIEGFALTRSLSLARPEGARRGRLAAAFDAWLLANGDPDPDAA